MFCISHENKKKKMDGKKRKAAKHIFQFNLPKERKMKVEIFLFWRLMWKFWRKQATTAMATNTFALATHASLQTRDACLLCLKAASKWMLNNKK